MAKDEAPNPRDQGGPRGQRQKEPRSLSQKNSSQEVRKEAPSVAEIGCVGD